MYVYTWMRHSANKRALEAQGAAAVADPLLAHHPQDAATAVRVAPRPPAPPKRGCLRRQQAKQGGATGEQLRVELAVVRTRQRGRRRGCCGRSHKPGVGYEAGPGAIVELTVYPTHRVTGVQVRLGSRAVAGEQQVQVAPDGSHFTASRRLTAGDSLGELQLRCVLFATTASGTERSPIIEATTNGSSVFVVSDPELFDNRSWVRVVLQSLALGSGLLLFALLVMYIVCVSVWLVLGAV